MLRSATVRGRQESECLISYRHGVKRETLYDITTDLKRGHERSDTWATRCSRSSRLFFRR